MFNLPLRLPNAVLLLVALTLASAHASRADAEEILLPTHQRQDSYTPCAAFGAEEYLVVWQSGRLAAGDLRKGLVPASSIVAVRVDAAGKLLDRQPLVISPGNTWQGSPATAFGDGVFLVVWHAIGKGNTWDVFAARVSPEGKLLDSAPLIISSAAHNQALPRVAFDGSQFVVLWQDYRSGERYEVFGARVTPQGKVLDPAGVSLASERGHHRNAPAIASAGSGMSLLLWSGDIRLGQGFTSGVVSLLGIAPTPGESLRGKREGPGFRRVPMSLAAGPANYLAAWTTDCSLGRDAGPDNNNAAIYDAAGKQLSTLWLAGKAGRIRDPAVVWDGGAYRAVWHQAVAESRDDIAADAVFTSRISSLGKPTGLRRLAGTTDRPAAQARLAANRVGGSLAVYERHPSVGAEPIQIGIQLLSE